MINERLTSSDISSTAKPTLEPSAVPAPDPISRWLALVGGLLIVIILAAVLSFTLYLRTVDAPRTVLERDIERYKAAIAEQPLEQEGYLRLAFAYAQANRFDLAQATIERARQLGETPDYLYAQAEVLRVSERYEDAILSYDAAVAESTAAYESTLRELEKQGVITASPNSQLALILLGRGIAYRQLGDSEAAIADFEAARVIAPTDASLLAALGDAYSQAGDTQAASEAYREALRFVADLPAALAGLRALGETP